MQYITAFNQTWMATLVRYAIHTPLGWGDRRSWAVGGRTLAIVSIMLPVHAQPGLDLKNFRIKNY